MDMQAKTATRATPTRVLVLGGFGFIGRHAVSALLRAGCEVVIGSRQPERHRREAADLPACAHRQVRLERCLLPEHWAGLIADVDVVLNCVGILRQRGPETYDRVHRQAPAALASACQRRGCRFIHVSALGLDGPVRSGFLRSKREGEQAIRAAGGDWALVRPSLLDAESGGFGARWVRRVARWPIHILPSEARGRIAALQADDLGDALAALVIREKIDCGGREYELGGLQALTLAELLAALRRLRTTTPALRLGLPPWLARWSSHLCDLLHFSPYSYGHLELLRQDNCPRHNRLPELLGRAPRAVGLSAPSPPRLPAAQPVRG